MRNAVLWTDVSVCHSHKVNVEVMRVTNISFPCSSIVSVLYELMYKQSRIFLPTSLPFSFLPGLSPFFITSNSRPNHLVLSHPMVLFDLTFNSDIHLSVLVLPILAWLNHYISVINYELQLLHQDFNSLSYPFVFFPQYFSKMSYPLLGFAFVSLCKDP